MFWKLKYSDRM